MFTGIIEHCGHIEQINKQQDLSTVVVQSDLNTSDIKVGDSISLNGVCLTATKFLRDLISFDIGKETLAVTTLAYLQTGQQVHLEKAMRLSDRLNGHMVQGHVDGIGIVAFKQKTSDCLIFRIDAPKEILKYSIHKGSITINGVSLTINTLGVSCFEVCLIPHTLEKTALGSLSEGMAVNLEADLIGKYIEKLIKG